MRPRKLKVKSYVKDRPRDLVVSNEPTEKVSGSIEGLTPYEINPGLTRRRAKELYILYYYTKEQLVEALGIPSSTLETWLYKPTEGQLSWHQERELFEQTVFAKMKERSSEEMSKALSRAMNILNRSLSEADMQGEMLKSTRDMKELMGVIKDLKHLVNTEEGKPNSIRHNVNITQAEARELLEELQELDPFYDYTTDGKIN